MQPGRPGVLAAVQVNDSAVSPRRTALGHACRCHMTIMACRLRILGDDGAPSGWDQRSFIPLEFERYRARVLCRLCCRKAARRDCPHLADKSRMEFKRQSLGDSFVSSSRNVSLVAAVRNSVLSSAWPSGQMRPWRTARRRRSPVSATRDHAQMRHRGTISDHHSQAKPTPTRKAKVKRGPAIVPG